MTNCSVDACERVAVARGLCYNHYQKMRRAAIRQKRLPATVSTMPIQDTLTVSFGPLRLSERDLWLLQHEAQRRNTTQAETVRQLIREAQG